MVGECGGREYGGREVEGGLVGVLMKRGGVWWEYEWQIGVKRGREGEGAEIGWDQVEIRHSCTINGHIPQRAQVGAEVTDSRRQPREGGGEGGLEEGLAVAPRRQPLHPSIPLPPPRHPNVVHHRRRAHDLAVGLHHVRCRVTVVAVAVGGRGGFGGFGEQRALVGRGEVGLDANARVVGGEDETAAVRVA